MQPIDINEVLVNLDKICKGSKFTYEEHAYLQVGLTEIKNKLKELEDLKAANKAQESK